MLEKKEAILNEFDEELWKSTIESVIVHSDHIVFAFKDGMELEWNI